MTDDQFWRIAILGGLSGLYVAFKPQIVRFMRWLGYTGRGYGKDE